ncbi:hypothetical protein D3C87_1626490 [compost metagenome]
MVFGIRPAVQHNQIVATPLALGQFAGADAGGVENFFGQFAEGFAGHIHAGERGVPVALPLGNAAGQTMHVAVAKPGQGAGGAFRRMVIASVVVHHHAHVVARGQAHDVHLQPAIRHRCGEKQMGLAVLPVFAHIQQGDLAAIVQPLLERVGINGCDGRGGGGMRHGI